MRRLLIGVMVTSGVVAGGGWLVAWSPVGEAVRAKMRPEPVLTTVRVEAAERGRLVRSVSAPGSVEPRRLVKISSQVSARVLELPFREGEEVPEGAVVVRLDPQNLVAQLESARAQLRSEEARLDGAKAALTRARIDHERLAQLAESMDIARTELDRAEAEHLQAGSTLRVIEHSIEIARANIERAEKDLANTVITSPMAGTITSLSAEEGETVVVGTINSPGSVIMEIADLSEMLVRAQVDESNIASVAVGQPVSVFIHAYRDREFEGEVRRIGLKRTQTPTGTGVFEAEILLRLAEGERLYSGLTASCEIAVEGLEDVVVVPSQAVVDRRVDALPREIVEGSERVDTSRTFARVVFVVEEGKAVAVPVEAGPSDLTRTSVLAGLDPGTRVVTGPYSVLVGLSHGTAVRVEGDPEPGGAAGGEGEAVAAGDGRSGEGAGEP